MDYLLFTVLAPLAAAALLGSIASVVSHRRLPAARPLLAAGTCIAGWLLLNTVEALAVTPDAKLFWARLTYVFIAPAPLAWLAFALVYTNQGGRYVWRWLTLLSVFPAATVALVFTNEFHGLIWASYTFYEVPAPAIGGTALSFLGMQVVHGPGYWLFAVYVYGCLLASAGLIIREHVRSFALYRRQSTWMVSATLAPLVANLVYLFGLIPGLQKDFAPLAFAFGTGVFTVLVRRHRLLDLKPIARKLLVERMRDGMLVLDASDRVVDLNPGAAAILALDGDRVIGVPIRSALRPEQGGLAECLGGAHERTVELCLPTGAVQRFYEVTVTPLADRAGRVTGRLLLLHDVTPRKEHEELLRQANLKLTQEYEEVDAFSRMVAHDLKGPVQSILGFSEILAEDYDDMTDDLRRDAFQTMMQSAQKMHRIINELLLLARVGKQPVEPAPLDTDAVVSEVLEHLRPEIRDRGAHVITPDEWPEALGHAPWIEQVWSNYVGNALKYGGSRPRIELGYTLCEDATIRFWVRDYGPGVPVNKQARLFMPFSRLGGQQVDGHGLGLWIVRRVMETLGGGFGVESSGVQGEGSTFYFSLPLTSAKAPSAASQALDYRMFDTRSGSGVEV